MVLQQRHRALAGVGLGVFVGCVVSLMVGGTDGIVAWMELGRYLMDVGEAYGIHPRDMVTLRSGIHVLLQTDEFAPVRLPWILASVAGLIVLAWSWRRPIAGSAFRLQLGAAVVAAVVISPHAYPHDLVLAVPLAVGLSAFALENLASRWAMATLATTGLLWFSPWVIGGPIPPAAVVLVLLPLLGFGFHVSRKQAVSHEPELEAERPPTLTAKA